MSIQYTVIEKITVMDSEKLPTEVRETIEKEAIRINTFRQRYGFSCEVMMNTGDGWKEYNGEKFSDDTISSVLRNFRNLVIFIRCSYNTGAFISYEGLPGFGIAQFLDTCDRDVFYNLSFEFFNQADSGDTCGNIVQYSFVDEDTPVMRTAEYEEITTIPDVFWLNEPCTVSVFASDLPEDCDPDAVNAAVRRLNATEYYPKEKLDDFHNADAEVIINQPRLETMDQRTEFLAALEEARSATKGCLIFDQPEFVDAGSSNVRMLMLDLDEETGAVRYYMTKPIGKKLMVVKPGSSQMDNLQER